MLQRCRKGRKARARLSKGAAHLAERSQWLEHQPAAVGNGRRPGFPVSGLLFTGNAATSTCRAVGARAADLPPAARRPVFSLLFTGADERQRWQTLSAREAP